VSLDAFAVRRRVRPEECDELGHANNVEYLRWILDAAAAHWTWLRAEGPAKGIEDLAWVVTRHEVDYLAQTFPGDELLVYTWVPSCTAMTCERCAEIERVADGVTLARSLSNYCVIDLDTRRPRRLSDTIRTAIGNPPTVKRDRTTRAATPRPPLGAEVDWRARG